MKMFQLRNHGLENELSLNTYLVDRKSHAEPRPKRPRGCLVSRKKLNDSPKRKSRLGPRVLQTGLSPDLLECRLNGCGEAYATLQIGRTHRIIIYIVYYWVLYQLISRVKKFDTVMLSC